ncbi:MAG TPA: hypothetical protein ENG87_01930 [Candidatus Pacearchaeota archaeon]|nr:hypothetical protein [Candidatus Pacearchaeota archaeon]HDZ60135.1 hypothetical protein [Candidatus Pacearchaeota archaeon]
MKNSLIIIGTASLLLMLYSWFLLPVSYISGILSALFGAMGMYCFFHDFSYKHKKQGDKQ